nr:hypothetical protein [Tanacetum cinerariifolium]
MKVHSLVTQLLIMSMNLLTFSTHLRNLLCILVNFYGNDAHYGHYCTPQALFIYPEPCYNQDFNFPQDFHNFPQQYPCCNDCEVTHEAYQCQPMNEVYYYRKNSCYDSTSIGFDQSQPQQYTVNHHIFNAHNDYLDSQKELSITLTKLMEQMTSLTSFCNMACQIFQKKQEEKQLEEEQVTIAQNWKLFVCYNDDDDEERSNSLEDNIISGLPSCSAITPIEPVLSTKEPDNSLSIGDEHLDTIPATKSDEVIKSSVENLIPIPSESEGIPEHKCDVPFHDNSPPLDVSKDQFEDFSKSNDEFYSIDDNSLTIDYIDYVEASPLDSELVSSEVMEIVIPEVGGIDDDILLTMKDNILHEKLLNVNLFIAKIKALNDNPTPTYTSFNSLLEETNTSDNSLPEFETFCFDVEEISSGSTTTRSDISLPEYEVFYDDHVKESDFYESVDELIPFISPPEYDCFLFKVEPNSRDFTKDVVEDISPIKEPQVHNALPTHPTLQLNMKFQPSSKYLFTYVVWIFLPFLVYSVAPRYLLSLRNEDTIFDPGICNSYFSRPNIPHQCGTFPGFNILPERPMEIFSSTCSRMDK